MSTIPDINVFIPTLSALVRDVAKLEVETRGSDDHDEAVMLEEKLDSIIATGTHNASTFAALVELLPEVHQFRRIRRLELALAA